MDTYLTLSPQLKQELSYLNDKVSNSLLEKEGEKIDFPITFISMSNNTGFFSGVTMKLAIDILSNKGGYSYGYCDFRYKNNYYFLNNIDSVYKSGLIFNNDKATQIKIGKFIKSIFGNEFSDKDIEDFVNKIKSLQEMSQEFELVSGDDIKKWYKQENYYSKKHSSLNNSCMNDTDFLDIYTKNPESVRLLILKKDNRILGRSLVWKIHKCHKNKKMPKFEYLMDKVYFNDDYIKNVFIDYAKKNNFAYICEYGISYNNYVNNCEMCVKVNPIRYNKFPYLDTFCEYDFFTGILSNRSSWDSKFIPKYRSLRLKSTKGLYESNIALRNGLYRYIVDFYTKKFNKSYTDY